MAKSRSIMIVGVIMLWTAMPALACLPTPAMTQAEMACCKKMAGDCQMGSDHHSCCKTEVRRTSSFLKSTSQTVTAPIDSSLVVPVITTADVTRETLGGLALTLVHSPPESPPFSPTILRI
jgi:hypothetical protein